MRKFNSPDSKSMSPWLRAVALGMGGVALVQLTGCASMEPPPLAHSPMYAPVYPIAADEPRPATGSIYNGRPSDPWFGRSRDLRVGDIVTILLDEATQGERRQTANVSRKASNDAVTPGLTQKVAGLSGIFGGINLSGAEIKSEGSGDSGQIAKLKGEISVTVVEVMPNGNLVLRGEKQVALSEGTEVIQVSGVIRPADVAPNNTVRSRRLTNAQFSYRGTGDIANANRPGWGTRGLFQLWPF